jgi:hypothetical protein
MISAYTALLAMWPPKTSWKVAKTKSLPSVGASWQKRAEKEVWQTSQLMLKFLCGVSPSARLRQHHAQFSVLFWRGKTPFQAEPVQNGELGLAKKFMFFLFWICWF